MKKTLSELKTELENIISLINKTIPNDEPLNVFQDDWEIPGITRNALINKAKDVITLIEGVDGDLFKDNKKELENYNQSLNFLAEHTIPNIWRNTNRTIYAYLVTLDSLEEELKKYFNRNHSADLQKVVRQIRALEARLKEVEPKTASLSSMVERIEHAFNTAEQLPADMDLLNEAREKIKDIIEKSTSNAERVAGVKEDSGIILSELTKMKESAEEILHRCETAYAASTSVGLAAAFSERSSALNKSMWFWIIGLIIALITAAIFGSYNVQSLLVASDQAQPSASVIATRLFLSALSICGPVWFAWLATKQIGQRFRLSEDYAFKASISRAYEGFRSEASRIDKNLESKLLASALSRLDELPLRLVETETHGSPYHELLASDAIKKALKVVPGFSDRVKSIAEQSLNAANDASKTVIGAVGKVSSPDKPD
ncbi:MULTISPECIES: hypothetical protein [Pectobacterium]|uniref:hypothetical protein n=1 Tax=Pectobacterium TaxID=122277 RepID=UPI001CF43397|nr:MULTISPECIES: hypothetical protein [Pectobacterium]MCA6962801.1 hypothetical protein [Pectobacterium odoriferum]MCH5010893.1 hypothetical protein [Pectobacterium odoriferum]